MLNYKASFDRHNESSQKSKLLAEKYEEGCRRLYYIRNGTSEEFEMVGKCD